MTRAPSWAPFEATWISKSSPSYPSCLFFLPACLHSSR